MAKDKYHDAVRNALVKDGWTITHDPYRISVGTERVYVDLGAERLLAAERGTEKIDVEVKTFSSPSDIYDLERALGQYILYRILMKERDPERQVVLAVPIDTLKTSFRKRIFEIAVDQVQISMIGYDPDAEEILEWAM